jgi:hypothetical protein
VTKSADEMALITTHSTDLSKDQEKQQIFIHGKASSLSVLSGGSSVIEMPEVLPAKNGMHGLRWLRHRAFILYRRFFSIVIFTNLAVACLLLYRKIKEDRYILADLASATAANLCVAVLMRSEPVVNLLFTIFCSVPVSNITMYNACGTFIDFVPQHLDLVSSCYPPPLRKDLPYWWHT